MTGAALLKESMGEEQELSELYSGRRPFTAQPHSNGQSFTPDLIDAFLTSLSESGKKADTISVYRRCLLRLYHYLPDEKMIYEGTLEKWRENLDAQQLSRASVELHCSSANSFMIWCGRWDLRIPRRGQKKTDQPELSRNEYLRLLSAAQRTEKERAYMLTKTFATLGISINELLYLTVEAVKKGSFSLPQGESIFIPACLREELSDFANRQNIPAGMIFQTSSGKAIDRSNIWNSINGLAVDARVDEAKCNPRCLSKLCQKTRGDIRRNVEVLERQMYDNLLETEQKVIGWENAG